MAESVALMTSIADSAITSKIQAVSLEPELPVRPGDVTADWLSRVLARKVKTATIDRIMPGTATKVFVTVMFDEAGAGPVKLCVKGGFNPDLIQMMPFVVMIYQREVDFYNNVAPLLEHMDLPKSWWAEHSSEQGIIIMEDLEAAGHSFGSPSKSWSMPSVLTGIEQLAALHARTWGVRNADYPWLTSDYDQALLHLMQTYEQVVHSPGRPTIPEYMKDQDRMTAVLKKHYASRNPKFNCLLHGDSHVSNTYLVNGKTRFLDWQMIHIGSAFHDVAYFIGGALDIQTRRRREFDILEYYLRTLEKLGGPVLYLKDEDVMLEYKKSFLAGVGPMMCPYEMQPREWVFPMAERYAAALHDHNVLQLVEALP
ncbi:unnamed protein product [Clonostachys rhizophaga]|uniref:CHK kinase-like domain-containing protein n=1 Tax=Clonostachys rhizophaga TaxID=160324 RepID=A0A9N9YH46_9HYPO|nr:unnamed protein product [Clonostachys rhizophaga]